MKQKSNKTKKKVEKFPHYWMCDDCAKIMGGVMPEGHTCTVIHDICKYCELPIEQMLIPWVDFNWPQDKSKDITAKLGRD